MLPCHTCTCIVTQTMSRAHAHLESSYEETLSQLESEHDHAMSHVQLNMTRNTMKQRESTAVAFAEMATSKKKLDAK